MGTTTIQVSTETRERETYDELLQRLTSSDSRPSSRKGTTRACTPRHSASAS